MRLGGGGGDGERSRLTEHRVGGSDGAGGTTLSRSLGSNLGSFKMVEVSTGGKSADATGFLGNSSGSLTELRLDDPKFGDGSRRGTRGGKVTGMGPGCLTLDCPAS